MKKFSWKCSVAFLALACGCLAGSNLAKVSANNRGACCVESPQKNDNFGCCAIAGKVDDTLTEEQRLFLIEATEVYNWMTMGSESREIVREYIEDSSKWNDDGLLQLWEELEEKFGKESRKASLGSMFFASYTEDRRRGTRGDIGGLEELESRTEDFWLLVKYLKAFWEAIVAYKNADFCVQLLKKADYKNSEGLYGRVYELCSKHSNMIAAKNNGKVDGYYYGYVQRLAYFFELLVQCGVKLKPSHDGSDELVELFNEAVEAKQEREEKANKANEVNKVRKAKLKKANKVNKMREAKKKKFSKILF